MLLPFSVLCFIASWISASGLFISFDRISPTQHATELGAQIPLELLELLVWQMDSLTDLLAWRDVSMRVRVLVMPILQEKYGRLGKRMRVVPDVSKIMTAMDKDGFSLLDAAIFTLLLDPFAQRYGPRNALEPYYFLTCGLLKCSRIPALPYIASVTSNRGLQLGQGMEWLVWMSPTFDDVVERTAAVCPKKISEQLVWKAIKLGKANYKLMHRLLSIIVSRNAQKNAEDIEVVSSELSDIVLPVLDLNNLSQTDPFILAYQVQRGMYDGKYVSLLYDTLSVMTEIPLELLCVLLQKGFTGIIRGLCEARTDIVVSGAEFWMQLLPLNQLHHKPIVEALAKNPKNKLACDLLLDPVNIDNNTTNYPADLVPLLFPVYAGKHSGILLGHLKGHFFKTVDVMCSAVRYGAESVVLRKILAVTDVKDKHLIENAAELLKFSDEMVFDEFIQGLFVRACSHHLQFLLKRTPDTLSRRRLVIILCRKSACSDAQLLLLLRSIWPSKSLRTIVLSNLEERLKGVKGDRPERTEFLDTCLHFILTHASKINPAYFELARTVKALLLKMYGGIDGILECVKGPLWSRVDVYKAIPVLFYAELGPRQFIQLVKDLWLDEGSLSLRLVKLCIDMRMDTRYLCHLFVLCYKTHPGLVPDAILYAIDRYPALISHIQKEESRYLKRYMLPTAYLARGPAPSIRGLMQLLFAFDYGQEDPRPLIHLCLERDIPEQAVAYLLNVRTRNHCRSGLSSRTVLLAALNPDYSDHLLLSLVYSCPTFQAGGALDRCIAILAAEKTIKRGHEVMHELRAIQRQDLNLPGQIVRRMSWRWSE